MSIFYKFLSIFANFYNFDSHLKEAIAPDKSI